MTERVLERTGDEVTGVFGADERRALSEVPAVQIVDDGLWPAGWRIGGGRHLLVKQLWRPAPEVQRTAAQAVGQASERRAAVPGQPPHLLTRLLTQAFASQLRDAGRWRDPKPLQGHVLHVLRQRQWTGLEHEDSVDLGFVICE
ncbi:MAG TPA: hypothetical protein VHI11_09815 [Jiangellaceae bacterium]|nr:hypothetical protein [Jiangellaceae bacterium]